MDPLLDRAPCGFVAFADDGTVRLVNATLLDMLQTSRDALVGRHIEKVLTVGSKVFYQTHLFPVLRLHGYVEEIFLLFRSADGEEVGALANAARRERDGEWVTDMMLMRVRERRKFEDALVRARKDADAGRVAAVTRRDELQEMNAHLEEQAMELELSQQQLSDQTEELERQRAIAEEANRAKSAFLAAMSHELRTPLNAIGGYIQLLEMGIHGPVNAAQLDAFQKVKRSQRHLLRLINEVLNLARVEAGGVHYDLQRVVLRDVVDAVLPMIEPQLAERSLSYELDVVPALAARADREKVEQVLLNLLGNAVKFTAGGGCVRVRARVAPESDRRVWLQVEDTGIGIPIQQQQRIFEPFVQVDVSPSGRAEGTGLGLAISRDLARGMGGDLSATSVVGEGSVFTLELPSA